MSITRPSSVYEHFTTRDCQLVAILVRVLPHYMLLNFGNGRYWCSASAAVEMGTTLTVDKNIVAGKSEVLPVSELPQVLGWESWNLGSEIVCL